MNLEQAPSRRHADKAADLERPQLRRKRTKKSWHGVRKAAGHGRKTAAALITRLDASTEDVHAWRRIESRVREAVQAHKLSMGFTNNGVTEEEMTTRILLVVRCADVAHRAVTPMYLISATVSKVIEHFGLKVSPACMHACTCSSYMHVYSCNEEGGHAHAVCSTTSRSLST